MKKQVWRALIEMGFIVFLFYSNLLMGEFGRSGMGRERGLAWALGDILTPANFGIAMIGRAHRLRACRISPETIVTPDRSCERHNYHDEAESPKPNA